MGSTILLTALMLGSLPTPQTPGGVISGHVLYENGKAAAGMRIAALREPEVAATNVPGRTTEGVAWTDATGFYLLEDVPSGNYRIRMGPEYETVPIVTTSAVPSVADPTLVVVSAGSRVEFDLVAPPEFTVRGHITDYSPVNGLRRVTLAEGFLGSLETTAVRPDGSFSFTGVRPGTYWVREGGDVPLDRSASVHLVDADVENVEIQSGVAPTREAETIGIRFETEGGAPMPTVVLSLQGEKREYFAASASANRPGDPIRIQLPTGRYSAAITSLPPVYSTESIRSGETDLLTDTLVVSRGTSAEVVVRLGLASPDDSFVVRGRVDPPTVDARSGSVVLVAPNFVPAEIPIEADGSFEFRNVPRGRYGVRVYPGVTVQSGSVDVQRDVLDLELTRRATVEVVGRLTVEGGLPLPPVTVRFDGGQGTMTSSPDSDGTFRELLAEGQYRVSIEPLEGFGVQVARSGTVDLLTNPVLVEAGSPPEIEITLEPDPNPPAMRTIRGRVVGISNLPTPRPQVQLRSSVYSRFPQREASLGDDGFFEFRDVYSGPYDVWLGTSLVGLHRENAHVIVTDEDVAGVRLIVPPQIRVRGQVIVEDERPIPSIGMMIGRYQNLSILPVSADGSFEVTLPPGRHQLVVTRLPDGYEVPSITYGPIDAFEEPLVLTGSNPEEIRIVFGR